MPFNGSGAYTLPSNSFNPAVSGTNIDPTDWNSSADDLETGLSTTITKDGQTTPTANLPMGGFKHTGVNTNSGSTSRSEYASGATLQDGAVHLVGTVAGTNTITGSLTPAITAYASGQKFVFVPANTNTGATTINLNSVGAKSIFWNGAAVAGGEIKQNVPVLIEYDGTQFHIIGNGFAAPFSDSNPVVVGATDATKKIRFEVDGLTTATTRVITAPDRDITLNNLSTLTNSISGNVALNNTGNYFTGPTVSQGSAGVWLAMGQVTLADTAGAASMNVKLWDGTNVANSSSVNLTAANVRQCVALVGVFTSPPGDIRIDVNDATSTSGLIIANSSGNSKDSTLTVMRIG